MIPISRNRLSPEDARRSVDRRSTYSERNEVNVVRSFPFAESRSVNLFSDMSSLATFNVALVTVNIPD